MEMILDKKIENRYFREHMPTIHPIFLQKRREHFAVNLRKEKRQSLHSVKRGIPENNNILILGALPESLSIDNSLSDLEKLLHLRFLLTENPYQTYQILKYLNSEFKSHQDALAGALINLDYLDIFQHYLNLQTSEEVCREACRIICNITPGPHEYNAQIVSKGLIDNLFLLVNKSYPSISDNSIWALSNLLADCEEFWVYIVDKGVISLVSTFAQSLSSISTELLATLSNFVMSISIHPHLLCDEDYLLILNIACTVLESTTHPSMLVAFSYLLRVNSMHKYFFQLNLQDVLFANAVLKGQAMRSCLIAIGNILMGSSEHVDALMKGGVLEILVRTLECEDKTAVRYSLWCVSNIAEGNREHLKMLRNHRVLVSAISLLLHTTENIRLEAGFVLVGVCKNGGTQASIKIREIGALTVIAQALNSPEPELLVNLLDSLEVLMINLHYSSLIEGSGCVYKLMMLENHPNNIVRRKAEDLVEDFNKNANLE